MLSLSTAYFLLVVPSYMLGLPRCLNRGMIGSSTQRLHRGSEAYVFLAWVETSRVRADSDLTVLPSRAYLQHVLAT